MAVLANWGSFNRNLLGCLEDLVSGLLDGPYGAGNGLIWGLVEY